MSSNPLHIIVNQTDTPLIRRILVRNTTNTDFIVKILADDRIIGIDLPRLFSKRNTFATINLCVNTNEMGLSEMTFPEIDVFARPFSTENERSLREWVANDGIENYNQLVVTLEVRMSKEYSAMDTVIDLPGGAQSVEAFECEEKYGSDLDEDTHDATRFDADTITSTASDVSDLVMFGATEDSSDKMANINERSFIMIKPDGVHRGLTDIIQRFEERGYKMVALKQMTASKAHLEEHYVDLKDKPFFPSLINYMVSGPVVVMVWQGLDIVEQGRAMLGAINPLASAPGSICGDYSIQTGRNICHGSESVDAANREIAHWFKDNEINECASSFINSWVYE